MIDGALAGRRVVVTRPVEDAGELVGLLEQAGATVVGAASIRIELDVAAVATALAGAGYYWVVVTSANGVRALAGAAGTTGLGGDQLGGAQLGGAQLGGARLAVVGPATAEAARVAGMTVALQPADALGAALVEAFPTALGPGRVLVVQADRAGPDVAEGLQAKGWTVDSVVAYRTVDVGRDESVAGALVGVDAVTFFSDSAARSFVAAYGMDAVPEVVGCIGPSTAAVCRQLGLPAAVVAEPHTVPALVRALASALAR